ncbi:MAG: MaoC family dehydratase [Hyphomicrobiaceae bacterium]
MSTYFEDLVVGDVVDIGAHTFARAEIVDFARRYDPQPFHLDDEAARRSLFGALCASGWHTAAVWLRHMLDHRKRVADRVAFRNERPAHYGPSPGFESLRWLKPVYVDDTIRFTSRIKEKIDWPSRPTVGLVLFQNEGFNRKGALVFAVTSKVFVERRARQDP